jgi:oxygen-independent coproporphyrinogen-3 oxidase
LTQIKVGAPARAYTGGMQHELIERYGNNAPRYTSYPTSPHFHDGIGAQSYREWLGSLSPRDIGSLYFHVPFCERLCWYCGCHTNIVNRPQQLSEYVELLTQEVDIVADAVGFPLRVQHLHWGGGTPSTIAAQDFRVFMAHVRKRFEITENAEIAIEIDPRTLSDDFVFALGDAGFNRASLGVQDFNEKVQRAINRVQSLRETIAAAARLRAAGIDKINLDLMYGLPHQTTADVIASIDQALTLHPDRIALFGYAHVPWMKRHQQMIPQDSLPDPHARMDQAEAAAQHLVANGFRHIGLDHFALPADPLCRSQEDGAMGRNFQGYTDDHADALLGFGTSAIGTLAQGYVQNAVAMPDYRAALQAGRPATVRGIRLEAEDRLRRDIIQTLMCGMGVDIPVLQANHHTAAGDLSDELGRLQPLVEDGLLECEDGVVRMTELGRPFVRTVCAVFDSYLNAGKARHSLAV